jgi:hypothetical protein
LEGFLKLKIWLWMLSLMALSMSARAQQNLGFSELAPKLGIPVAGESCPYTIDQLVDGSASDIIEAWKKSTLSNDEQQKWNCQHLTWQLDTDNLKDCRPDPRLLQSGGVIPKKEISSKLRYFLFVKEPYKYDLERDAVGLWTVTVRVAFKNALAARVPYWEDLMKHAEKIWNSNQQGPLKVTYRFIHVAENQNPHFSIRLYEQENENPRHMFTDGWSDKYTDWTLAHEMGHMMGLNDEYDQKSMALHSAGNFLKMNRCSGKQLMCNSWWESEVASYYHYLIVRRAFCQ